MQGEQVVQDQMVVQVQGREREEVGENTTKVPKHMDPTMVEDNCQAPRRF